MNMKEKINQEKLALDFILLSEAEKLKVLKIRGFSDDEIKKLGIRIK